MDNPAASLNLLMSGAIFGAAVCFVVGAIAGGLLLGVSVLLIFAAIGAHLLSMLIEDW